MKVTRTTTGRITCAVLAIAMAACESAQVEQAPGTRDGTRGAADGARLEPRPAAVLAGRVVGPVEFRRYDGAAAGDARLAALVARLAAAVDATVVVAEDRAGVTFLPGRGAVVTLIDADADADADARGDVKLRLVGGVRRPVIRIPARGLLSGEIVPEAHFPVLLVQAAVIASAGDRVPPAWLRAGLGPEITTSFDRLLHERALGGDAVVTDASALFPIVPGGDDPLRAAVRVRALTRIARGDRPLARFVVARLEGKSEEEALAAVGVQDAAFLEAAAETERDRARNALLAGGPVAVLGGVRDALRQGDPSRANDDVAVLERELAAGTMSPWFSADAQLTAAQYALVAGDLARARSLASSVLDAPEHLVRVREARLCLARVARASGEQRAATRLFREYLSDFPGAPGSDEALESLGVDAAIVARLPGIAEDMTSSDPQNRARAAVRLGETGDAATAPSLRRLVADEDANVRRLAYGALSLVLGPESVPELDAGTRDADASVRGAALAMLAFADPARGETRARELTKDRAPDVAVVVKRILAPIREREAREVEAAERARHERALREAAQKRAAEKPPARPGRKRGAAPIAPPKPIPARPVTRTVPNTDPARRAPAPKTRTPQPTRRVRETPLPPPRPPRPLPPPDSLGKRAPHDGDA